MRARATLSLLLFLFAVFCVAAPEAVPEPEPQDWTQNAPFSGAIYIVNPDGQAVTAQGDYCPSYASVSCSNINQPSWCCPNSYTCASPANSNGLIGCCPAGSSCGGVVNVQSVTTITVQAQQQTAVVYAQPPQTTVYVEPRPTQANSGFCATITMDGPGLPRAEEGYCGTILIVSAATPTLVATGVKMGVILAVLHLAMGLMFA